MPNQGTSLPQVTQDDLKGNNPTNLNQNFKLLATQIQGIVNNSGTTQINQPVAAKTITLSPQSTSNLPGDNQAVTFGLMKSLFSPQALKQSLITNNFLGTTVTSLPGGSGTGLALVGTHSARLTTHPASASPIGTFYYENDRSVLYLDELVNNVPAWVYIGFMDSGTTISPSDNRPSDLGANDNGFLFYGTDTKVVYQWVWNSMSASGAWDPLNEVWPILQDTAANLTNYPASHYQPGTLYYETDRKVFYIMELVGMSAVPTWLYSFGTMSGTTISTDQRPSGLGTSGAGFLFYSTDAFLLYQWSGSGWVLYYNFTPIIADTHANRLANYPASRYAIGQPFIETDRSALYFVNSTPAWELVCSSMTGADASKPAGLGSTDIGFQYNATDTFIIYVWGGAAWVAFAAGGGYATATGGSAVLTTTPSSVVATAAPKAGRYMVVGSFDFTVSGAGDAGMVLYGSLSGASANATLAGAVGTEATVSQTWITGLLALAAPISLVAAKVAGTGTSTCNSSTLTAVWVSAT